MEYLKNLSTFWQMKTLTGLIVMIFSPVEVSFVVLLTLILIDTVTGTAQACKFRHFNSNCLRKAVNKVILYGISIITARLLEMGILFFFQTFIFSQIILGFLIMTEVISITENLILLGVPIPKDFITLLLKNITVLGLDNVVRQSLDDHNQAKEIQEIINYQIPSIKNQQVRKLMEIEFEGWSKVILFIKRSVDDDKMGSGEVLYLKIMAYIQTVKKENDQKKRDFNLSRNCIEEFENWHRTREEQFLQNVKNICYSLKESKDKKNDLVDRIMILIYQTILDAYKNENTFKCL